MVGPRPRAVMVGPRPRAVMVGPRPRAVMVGPRPHVFLTLPLHVGDTKRYLSEIFQITGEDGQQV